MKRPLTFLGLIMLVFVGLRLNYAADIKFVTEYRYPTAFDVQPIFQMTPNGPQVVGGIVTPRDFETREVGCQMSVYAEVGRIAGLASVTDGIKRLNQNTDLMLAAASGDYRSAKRALVGRTSVNAQNRFGSTALMGAAAGGFDSIVELLLAHKADPNIQSQDGSTALAFAAKNGNLGAVRALVEKGAHVNVMDHAGQTPLMLAAQGGHADVVRFLLQQGADPRLRDRNGNTAAMLAKARDDRSLVVLLTQGSNGR